MCVHEESSKKFLDDDTSARPFARCARLSSRMSTRHVRDCDRLLNCCTHAVHVAPETISILTSTKMWTKSMHLIQRQASSARVNTTTSDLAVFLARIRVRADLDT